MLDIALLTSTNSPAVQGARECVGVPSRAGVAPGVASDDGRFCCSGQCGVCGGARCAARPGGAAECCPGWPSFEAAAGVCAVGMGTLPCAIQELGLVECPIGFERVDGGELCLRRFGGGDGTPPLAHAAARDFCRSHFNAQLAAPRSLVAHRAAVAACDGAPTSRLGTTASLTSCWLGASAGSCTSRYGYRHTGTIMSHAKAEGLEQCCSLCRKTEGCRFWSYVTRDRACEMLQVPTGSAPSAGLGDAAGTVSNDHWAWDDGLPIKQTDAFGESTEAFDAWAAGKPSGTYRGFTLTLTLTLTLNLSLTLSLTLTPTLTLTLTPTPYPNPNLSPNPNPNPTQAPTAEVVSRARRASSC